MTDIPIRPFTARDARFVISLAARFADFDLPEWRRRNEIEDFFRNRLRKAVEQSEPDAAIFIAEDESGEPMGFVHVQSEADHFSGEKRAFIPELAVASSCEGRGVGQRLLEAAEGWARERGHDVVALCVFDGNLRARHIYEKHGFVPELVWYAKRVPPK